MFSKSETVKCVCLIAAVLPSLVSSVVFARQAQPVYSLKDLGEHQTAQGVVYTKVEVKCNIHNEKRYIHRVVKADQWCVNGDASQCNLDRIAAATDACLASEVVAAPVFTPKTAETTAAQAERKRLEAELIDNEQRKIELRNRQLQLRERELELKKKKGGN